jgi:hypothetical protein
MESRMSHLRNRGWASRLPIMSLVLLMSLALAGAANAEFPTKRSDPSVRGTPQEGQTLSGQTGQWLMADGLSCTDCTYRYTWQRCNDQGSGCADVPGATGFSYLLGSADVGKRIRIVEWIFKRDCGEVIRQGPGAGTQECHDVEKNGTSSPTAVVTSKPVTIQTATAPPTLAGLAMEEEVLRATGGTWTGPGTATKAFFWQRCNSIGEGCATIVGATAATYKLTSEDVGQRLRVIETATNEGGVAQAVSATTAVIIELKPTATRPTIAATRVALPHRLIADQVVVRQAGDKVTVKARVSDDRGFRITGVLVRITPTALLSGSSREKATDRTGWATFTFKATGSGSTYVYVEAHKKGERLQAGVSTANLFKVRVR